MYSKLLKTITISSIALLSIANGALADCCGENVREYLAPDVIPDPEPQPLMDEKEKSLPPFFKDSTLSLKFRNYYYNRDEIGRRHDEIDTLGIHLNYESGWWNNMSIGLGAYAAEGLYRPAGKTDNGFLRKGRKGFIVPGETFLKIRFSENEVCLFRQRLMTPYVNIQDNRVVPQIFEAYTLQSKELENFTFMVSQVTKIKKPNSPSYDFPSEAAGFKGEHKMLTLLGVIYEPSSKYKLQAWNYYSYGFMNTLYGQGDVNWNLSEDVTLLTSVQGTYQNNVGKSMGGRFHTGLLGARAKVDYKGFSWFLAGSKIDLNSHVRSPYGCQPGFTGMTEICHTRAGEAAISTGISYNFERVGINGLTTLGRISYGKTPHSGAHASPNKRELDLIADYVFPGMFTGLSARAVGAWITGNKNQGGTSTNEYRLILNYTVDVL